MAPSARVAPNAPEVLVVGGGHNGLVAAAYLAKAGRSTLVLERSDRVGGAAVSRSMYPEFTYSNCSYVCSLLRPSILRDLDLPRFGLQIIPYDGGCTLTRTGDYLALYDDKDALFRELSRHSRRDAESYARYVRDVLRQCHFIKPLLEREPVDPTGLGWHNWREFKFLAKHVTDLGEQRLYDTWRFFTMSAADFLDEYFESDLIKAHLAGTSIIGTGLSPRSPGSAYVLLHHYMGDIDETVGAWGFARGGMGAITSALAQAYEGLGGQIRTEAEVERFLVKNERVCGVRLSTGEEIYAPTVLSNLDVKRTFLTCMDPRDVPAPLMQSVQRFKIRGSSGKLNIALDELPLFPALPADAPCRRGDMHITDTMESLEWAYDDWKAGRWSARPYVDMLIPSQIDPTMAPVGKHYMSVFVQYCPYELHDGAWTDAKRQAFGDCVINAIAAHSPNFKSAILHTEIRTPWDLEQEVGLTEGNIFQGELTLDQLYFNRPVPECAQYATPIRGLYLCGSSTHPGGGVMGAPGANAARRVLRDLRS